MTGTNNVDRDVARQFRETLRCAEVATASITLQHDRRRPLRPAST
ncbi:hypothetical protein ACFTWF_22505 [Rhodococcus sp. NPDC056960]